ncbi:VanY-A/VanY-F/VanY-M family D-Ala-D-Ala carboxypeptidase [Lysinibacillus sp. Ag94]|uniref:VanY-A/VanY-F/VanY-M family D-Ala-D-Ala carboxypeptidase n=1 Tax=Lysinibacillus sp. Ag94 TaxID=2936682 RepID=UPI00200FB3B5|nr:VanY-A/VanY-F/VanY-M family D-Ala-D-Ala carboxypeptidase [Lysinibacillus sp. Ag94]UPW84935.1 VanY-A/VanY-F/VanY-M family D-Ala-D-Ala carboxypeptidase [Lysinibacillus sp. Ag94]
MKKLSFLIFAICIGVTAFKIVPFSQDEKGVIVNTYNANGVAESKLSPGTMKNVEIPVEQIYQGNLLLVNSKHPVHNESIKSDVIHLYARKELVKGYRVFNSETYLSEDIASKFSNMVLDAKKDGVSNFLISSGFRGFDEQTKLYKEMGSNRALPAGYSEHNLGLSLDVGSTQGKMEVAPEGEWIAENAWKYGFTLRYPEDKTDITGIMNEPWHIRYVGLPHSAIMKEKNFVLEEYLDYIKEEKHISATVNGQKNEIFYYPVTENITINVPANLRYEVSGNNTDGVIVTVFPDDV